MTQKLSLATMLQNGITDKMIQDYATELKDWLHRQVMIEDTKDHPDESQRWAQCPKPEAHPLVMKAVNENGDIDYQTIDDTQPLKDAAFAKKKADLFNQVVEIEQKEKSRIMPDGKIRLIGLHEQRIIVEDAVRRNAIILEDKVEAKDIEPLVISTRPTEDHEFMIQLNKIKEEITAVNWWGAERFSEIADLTEDTIDNWKMMPYKA